FRGAGRGWRARGIPQPSLRDLGLPRARARGVPITLESACTYCTKLLSAFVAASDCHADWRLYEEPQGHGCVWTITADSLNQGAGVHERDH
ncbi:hypothetical protein, partial [Pseudomonas aeruginosa]|uniref:hypothetical protein n=1 Tax=Pseudomonas aeruginosa TaxID=287 RepID=UPI00149592BA